MRPFILPFVIVIGLCFPSLVRGQEVIELTTHDVVVNKALFYKGISHRGSVLAHQSGATKESWHELARLLAERGISSVSLSSVSTYSIRSAIEYLKARGRTEIILIGASMGGNAIMQTVKRDDLPIVSKIILLAPSAGPEMVSKNTDKLVIVAKRDVFKSGAYTSFKEAVQPKTLLEYDGAEHGQALLKGAHRESVLNEILKFIN